MAKLVKSSVKFVCAVFTISADQSFPENEIIVHQRNKNIVSLNNVDKRVEPFTYPLFYPAGTDGFSPDLQLQTPYSSRSHLTRLELAQYRLLFRPEFVKFLTESSSTEVPDSLQIKLEDGTILQQLPQDRPDIVARAAKLKFDQIIEDLYKKQVFGKVSAFVYTIEFQKRGLPHMHLLIIMTSDDKIHQPEELDDLISSEIPRNDDLELRELVLQLMIHNPCGDLNPNATCMVHKNGRTKCRFDFPKSYQEVTLVDNGKPNYRRRYNPQLDPHSPQFSHEHAVYRKDINGRRITQDNRHVAPYNAYLLKK
ncbi:unnamed protein product, partial [Brenthis ino]